MKCQNCEKEANFHYKSVVNGETTEYHLCADCAREQGLDEVFSFNAEPMFASLMNAPFGSLMSNFFSMPFGRLAAPSMVMPLFRLAAPETDTSTETEAEKTDNIPKDAGDAIRAKRELISLKHQLHCAVRAEDYEKAIELRDKIKEMEK